MLLSFLAKFDVSGLAWILELGHQFWKTLGLTLFINWLPFDSYVLRHHVFLDHEKGGGSFKLDPTSPDSTAFPNTR